jgi:DNA-binding NtrC family response regulator
MPGLSGVELLSLVRQQNPQTPVIVISGISDKAYAEGLLRMGAFDYILKPFSLDAVEASVALALEVSRERKGK